MAIEIIDLDQSNLDSAIECVKASFIDIVKTGTLPERSLRASLEPSLADGHVDMQSYSHRQYWVGLQNGKVAGVIGLMAYNRDAEEALWISWFCVHPSHRKQGFGEALLSKAVDEARRIKKPFLRLWTTDSPNEAIAQFLYEKMGFVVTAVEPCNNGQANNNIYREKVLKELVKNGD